MKKIAVTLFVALYFIANANSPNINIEVEEITTNKWKLLKALSPKILYKTGNKVFDYFIPKGFETDFRSGPSILDGIAPKYDSNNEKINLAWLIHDVNYEGYISRLEADILLREMLIDAHQPKYNSWAIYYGLRALGFAAYNKKRNPDVRISIFINEKYKEKNMEFSVDDIKNTSEKQLTETETDSIIEEIRKLYSTEDAEKIINQMQKEIKGNLGEVY